MKKLTIIPFLIPSVYPVYQIIRLSILGPLQWRQSCGRLVGVAHSPVLCQIAQPVQLSPIAIWTARGGNNEQHSKLDRQQHNPMLTSEKSKKK